MQSAVGAAQDTAPASQPCGQAVLTQRVQGQLCETVTCSMPVVQAPVSDSARVMQVHGSNADVQPDRKQALTQSVHGQRCEIVTCSMPVVQAPVSDSARVMQVPGSNADVQPDRKQSRQDLVGTSGDRKVSCWEQLPQSQIVRARKVQWWEQLAIAIVFFWFLAADIYSNLEKRCKDYVLQTGMFDYMGSEDWYLLQRAGLACRRARQRLEAESQSLTGACSTTHARGCFFIDVSILRRTLVVPIGLGTWREDVRRRLKTTDLPKGLQEQLALAEWRFDGKRLADGTPGTKLVDGIARLDVPVLRGGMAPKKQYNQMKEKDLRKLCSKDTIARHRKDASGKLIQKSKNELVAGLEAWD